MPFELTDECFIAQIWFAAWHQTDWMGMVSRSTADAPWEARYRFRYYGGGSQSLRARPEKLVQHPAEGRA